MAGVRRMKKQPPTAKRPLLSQELIEILEQKGVVIFFNEAGESSLPPNRPCSQRRRSCR
jgi:hypothetical protein